MNASNPITPFNFEDKPIRFVMDDQGNPWFNAGDVCAALEYTNSRQTIDDHVDEDDVSIRYTIDTLGRKQPTNHINESGLYALIFGSTKPEAKRFKRWVTSEVLPSIRKTGQYQHPEASQEAVAEPMEEDKRRPVRLKVEGWPVELCHSSTLLNSCGEEVALIDSREVASIYDRDHFPLLRQLRSNPALFELVGSHFEWWHYTDRFKREIPFFLMTRDGFTMLTHRWRRPGFRDEEMGYLARRKHFVYKAFDQLDLRQRQQLAGAEMGVQMVSGGVS
ncbi:MAG: hypothetical protein HQL99_14250 [Magnetococcales bacterium]|nr:hypothetical protein [Magnetococcales bacterium]